jgi:hypothetical protein
VPRIKAPKRANKEAILDSTSNSGSPHTSSNSLHHHHHHHLGAPDWESAAVTSHEKKDARRNQETGERDYLLNSFLFLPLLHAVVCCLIGIKKERANERE